MHAHCLQGSGDWSARASDSVPRARGTKDGEAAAEICKGDRREPMGRRAHRRSTAVAAGRKTMDRYLHAQRCPGKSDSPSLPRRCRNGPLRCRLDSFNRPLITSLQPRQPHITSRFVQSPIQVKRKAERKHMLVDVDVLELREGTGHPKKFLNKRRLNRRPSDPSRRYSMRQVTRHKFPVFPVKSQSPRRREGKCHNIGRGRYHWVQIQEAKTMEWMLHTTNIRKTQRRLSQRLVQDKLLSSLAQARSMVVVSNTNIPHRLPRIVNSIDVPPGWRRRASGVFSFTMCTSGWRGRCAAANPKRWHFLPIALQPPEVHCGEEAVAGHPPNGGKGKKRKNKGAALGQGVNPKGGNNAVKKRDKGTKAKPDKSTKAKLKTGKAKKKR